VAGAAERLLAAFLIAHGSFTFCANAVEAEVYSGLALTPEPEHVTITMLWVERSRDFSASEPA
jgi:hypothetical protein